MDQKPAAQLEKECRWTATKHRRRVRRQLHHRIQGIGGLGACVVLPARRHKQPAGHSSMSMRELTAKALSSAASVVTSRVLAELSSLAIHPSDSLLLSEVKFA